MITHEEIEQTLRLLSSRHEDVSSLSPLMQEAISTVRSATKQTGQSNNALADFCNENLDELYYEIFNSPITKTPISLGYENESVSATNTIFVRRLFASSSRSGDSQEFGAKGLIPLPSLLQGHFKNEITLTPQGYARPHDPRSISRS